MPKTIFDLRNATDDRFSNTNAQLRIHRPEYLSLYGEVGSVRWWRNHDGGFLCRDTQVGFIKHIGTDPDWGEEPVVVIQTDRRDRAYDSVGWWTDSEIVEGAWVQIERVKVHYVTSTGPMTELIDTRIHILDCGPEQ
jgi:hypothetical protein